MSRIGKKIIQIPEKVKVEIKDRTVKAEGPKGGLEKTIPFGIEAIMSGNTISVKRAKETRETKAFFGLSRTIIANMVQGVSEGFEKKLEIEGLGFKALVQGQKLNLTLGYTKPIEINLPKNVIAKVDANTKITLMSPDKELVGRLAAEIRQLRLPEPYKGTGIKYAGEVIIRKVGKTTGAGAA